MKLMTIARRDRPVMRSVRCSFLLSTTITSPGENGSSRSPMWNSPSPATPTKISSRSCQLGGQGLVASAKVYSLMKNGKSRSIGGS